MSFVIEQLLSFKALFVALTLAIFFLSELIWPKAPIIAKISQGRNRLWRWCKNFGLFGLNVILGPLFVIPVTVWAADYALLWREGFNTGIWLLIDLLILDIMLYWWHRLNHEIPFLWRFHQVHHLDEFLDSTSSVRFHFGEVVFSALFRIGFILALGISLQTVIIFETLLMAATIFQHSNIRLGKRLEGLLSLIIITPSIHWVHHHAKQVDTDSNYGTVLSIWDRLFRSKSTTQRTRDMKIGVEGHRDLPIWGLLKAPFKPQKHRSE